MRECVLGKKYPSSLYISTLFLQFFYYRHNFPYISSIFGIFLKAI